MDTLFESGFFCNLFRCLLRCIRWNRRSFDCEVRRGANLSAQDDSIRVECGDMREALGGGPAGNAVEVNDLSAAGLSEAFEEEGPVAGIIRRSHPFHPSGQRSPAGGPGLR